MRAASERSKRRAAADRGDRHDPGAGEEGRADEGAEGRAGEVAERLRRALGVPHDLSLVDQRLAEAVHTVRGEVDTSELVALTLVEVVGRQLLHQYPMSSLIWDGVNDELVDVLGAADLTRVARGVWNRPAGGGRTLVVQLVDEVLPNPDLRQFTLRWGIALPTVSFCRHHADCRHQGEPGAGTAGPGAEGPVHQISCCAVSGDLGAVRPRHGSHRFVITVGMVLEHRSARPPRLVGREGFRARLHRLVNFCDRLAEREHLLELVSNQPWPHGVGVAERLRDADPTELDRLLD